ncbi:MAG: peptidyl-prolyl cis-trans isomerase [Desulfobacula sp.]|nr:peptidyl-prolyl cis-trans isomerase [Desulfobacula sp.]
MLRYLRENTGNWIIKIFLRIIVIVFVFLGVGSFGSKRNDSIVTINDESITIKEYQQAYKAIVDQMRATFGKNLNDDILKALNVKQQALDSLIEQKLVLAQADKLEIMVSEKELQDNLFSIKAFQKNGRFNIDQYKKVLSLNSLNPEIFEFNQLNLLRQQKVKDIVLSTVNVSDFEARDWYIFNNTQTAVDYLQFDPDNYSGIQPDEKQINSFYAENKDRYKSEPKLNAVYLKFSPKDYQDKIKITQANIKDYYEQSQEQFKIPQKVEARHILIKVAEDAKEEKVNEALKRAQDIFDLTVKGEDFEQLAKQYSEGPTKDNGGYLGIFDKQSMVKPFADKAFSLGAGEISKPVRTTFGWHLIKVVAKFDASIQTLAMASENIKKGLEQLEMQNLAYYKAGEAFDAVIDGDDFEQVALIANKKLVSTKDFDISGQGLEIEDNKSFASACFDLNTDAISDVKEIGGSYYLIKIVKKIEPVLQAIDIVSDTVLKDLKLKLQIQKAKEDAQLIVSKISDGKTLENLSKENNFVLKSTKLFTRNSSVEDIGNSSAFVQASFSLSENNTIFPEIIEVASKYFIVGFKEIKYPEETEIIENLKTVKTQISSKKLSQYYQAWVNELKNNSKINYDNPEILN